MLPVGNRIIDALVKTKEPLVLRRAEIVRLSQGEPTTRHSRPMVTVDFPIPGTLLSIMGAAADGSTAEVASVGTEGFVEVDAALRHTIAKRTSICQFAGEVIRIPLIDFQEALVRDSTFADHVYHAVRTRIFLTEQLRMCALRHTTAERLARWLLVAAYRTRLKELPATHDMVSGLLGTRRASVSIAAAQLHKAGAISYGRGIITVEDHQTLFQHACECYVICREALEENA